MQKLRVLHKNTLIQNFSFNGKRRRKMVSITHPKLSNRWHLGRNRYRPVQPLAPKGALALGVPNR